MSRNVQSLERGLAVLELLVRHGATGVTDLAEALDLDKTIVHRLLGTLLEAGYVRQDSNRKYAVGPRLRMIGAKVLSELDLRTIAIPYMQQLAEHTRSVSHLAKMAESRAIYIERVQVPGLTFNSTDVGGEAPGYCSAAGKVLWAHMPQSELSTLMDRIEFRQHTTNTITDRQALLRHLAEVREQGYAIDNEEHRLGLIGIGAPIYDHMGSVIGAICVGELTSRTNEERVGQTRQMVIDFAQRLSHEMGYSNGDLS